MRVIVKIHELARRDFEEWQSRLRQPPTGHSEIASIQAEEMIRQLIEFNGIPPAAKQIAGVDPPCWIWRFSTDLWVQFVHREKRTGWWGGTIREVIVTAMANRPADEAERGTAPP